MSNHSLLYDHGYEAGRRIPCYTPHKGWWPVFVQLKTRGGDIILVSAATYCLRVETARLHNGQRSVLPQRPFCSLQVKWLRQNYHLTIWFVGHESETVLNNVKLL